jgi:multicomponent Na+:H+ antiporter subunit D
MTWMLVTPVIIPYMTAVATFFVCNKPHMQRFLAVFGSVCHLGASWLLLMQVHGQGILAGHMGGWPAPFGITFAADHLGSVMVLITAIIGLAVVIYSFGDIPEEQACFGHLPLLQILVGAICGAFLTGDIFNLYVWFEVMLMASFGLLVHGGGRKQLIGAVKYVALNLISTILFLISIGLLYGVTGSLNMADIHLRVASVQNDGLLTTIAMMFMVAFGIKSAVFPLFFWLPAAYHTPPVCISAIFSGLLTKVGVYSMIRVFTLIFTGDIGYTHQILLVVAALTMITGVLGAACQNEFRRILSFHIISQIGYMVMGLALFTPLALAGAVFYLIHHIVVKTNLFLVSGVANKIGGSFQLKHLGGLYRFHGFLSLLFFIPAFSLAGFPPLSGFWAKLILIKASLDIQSYGIAVTALITGLLTIYSMTKIWGEAFWKPSPKTATVELTIDRGGRGYLVAPMVGLAILTLIIGLWAEPFFQFSMVTAEELLHPERYVQAVLGVTP